VTRGVSMNAAHRPRDGGHAFAGPRRVRQHADGEDARTRADRAGVEVAATDVARRSTSPSRGRGRWRRATGSPRARRRAVGDSALGHVSGHVAPGKDRCARRRPLNGDRRRPSASRLGSVVRIGNAGAVTPAPPTTWTRGRRARLPSRRRRRRTHAAPPRRPHAASAGSTPSRQVSGKHARSIGSRTRAAGVRRSVAVAITEAWSRRRHAEESGQVTAQIDRPAAVSD
jgi:hypothetical protein